MCLHGCKDGLLLRRYTSRRRGCGWHTPTRGHGTLSEDRAVSVRALPFHIFFSFEPFQFVHFRFIFFFEDSRTKGMQNGNEGGGASGAAARGNVGEQQQADFATAAGAAAAALQQLQKLGQQQAVIVCVALRARESKLDGVYVRDGQEQVRKLQEENVNLQRENAQLQEQLQKAYDDGKKQVCCVCLFHTRVGICVQHVSGQLCICRRLRMLVGILAAADHASGQLCICRRLRMLVGILAAVDHGS